MNFICEFFFGGLTYGWIKISIWFWLWEGSYPRWWPRGIFRWTTAKNAQGCADVIIGGCLISILVLRLLRDCNSYLFNPGCLGLWCFWKLQCYNSCLYNSTKTSGNTKTFGEKLHLWSRCRCRWYWHKEMPWPASAKMLCPIALP